MTSVWHFLEMELGVFEVLPEFLAELLHRVVLFVVIPIDIDRGAFLGGGVELVHQHHDRLGARAVEIDELEIEAAGAAAKLPQIGIERGEHRAVKLGDVLGVRLSRDLQMVLHEVEAHRRGAGGGLNIQLVSHRSDSQMVALRAKNAWVASTSVKSNSIGLEARRAISMKPRPAPLLPSSGSALSCSLYSAFNSSLLMSLMRLSLARRRS